MTRWFIAAATQYGISEEVLRNADTVLPFEELRERRGLVLWDDAVALAEAIYQYTGKYETLEEIARSIYQMDQASLPPYARVVLKMPTLRAAAKVTTRYSARVNLPNIRVEFKWLDRGRYRNRMILLHDEDVPSRAIAHFYKGSQRGYLEFFKRENIKVEMNYENGDRRMEYVVSFDAKANWLQSLANFGRSFCAKQETWEMFLEQSRDAEHLTKIRQQEVESLLGLVENMSEPVIMVKGADLVFSNKAFNSLAGGPQALWASLFWNPKKLEEAILGVKGESGVLELQLRGRGEARIPVSVRVISSRVMGEEYEALIQIKDLLVSHQPEEIVVLAREKERKRIAHNMHDSLGQLLTATSFQLASLEQTEADQDRHKKLENASRLVREVTLYTRSLTRQLDLLIDDCETLSEALERLMEEFQIIARVQIRNRLDSVHGSISDRRMIEEMSHIFQEAFNNAYRHGRAKILEISSEETEGGWFLLIDDDGSGLHEAAQGLGMRMMKHRARELGSEMEIKKSPLGGVRLQFQLSLPSNEIEK